MKRCAFFASALYCLLFAEAPLLANTYYVDFSSGNDSNDALSPTSAWKTMEMVNGTTFTPGDSVLFKRGEIWREQLTVPSPGEKNNPIYFGAYGAGPLPIISGADLVNGKEVRVRDHCISDRKKPMSYIVFEDLHVTANKSSDGFKGAIDCRSSLGSNWTINRCKIVDGNGNALMIMYDKSTVSNCIISKFPGTGIVIHINNENSTFENNDVSRCVYGISIEGNGHTIKGNDIHHHERNGLIANVADPLASDNTIIYNAVHNCGLDTVGYGDVTNLDGTWLRIKNSLIAYNLVYDNKHGHGIHLDDGCVDNLIYNNVVYGHTDNADQGGIRWGTGIHLEDGIGKTRNNIVKNNIGFNNFQHVALNSKNNILDYNNWDAGSAKNIGWTGTQAARTLEDWQQLTGQDANSISANPKFKDAAGGVFTLMAGSPCIDAGTDVGLTRDLAGISVPLGNGVDIGAVEFNSDDQPPGVPKNVRVNVNDN